MEQRDNRKGWRLVVTGIVWATYGLALATPVMDHVGMGDQPLYGFGALTMGWSGLGIATEMANVALLVGWIGYMVRQNTLAMVCGVLALMLASTAPVVYTTPLEELRIGFYLWLAAMVLFCAASTWEFFAELRQQNKGETLVT